MNEIVRSLMRSPSKWMSRTMRREDRVVVIVGAASSAALRAAWRFARRGARVVLADLNAPQLIEGAKAIRRAGGSVTHVVANAAHTNGARAISDHAELMFGPVDLWIDPRARRRRSARLAIALIAVGGAVLIVSRWAKAS